MAVSFFAILLFLFLVIAAIVAVVLVLTLRRRSQPRGFDVMERQRNENQP
jgi:hypothetical protein